MDLYGSRNSGNTARSVFALIEAAASFEPRLLDPQLGETRSASYLALNPMGKIPTLVDGRHVLWESNAINLYVAAKHADARLLPAGDAHSLIHQWLFFQAGHIAPACSQISFATNVRVQTFWKVKGNPIAAEAAQADLARFLSVLERALQGRSWLVGDFSLADIAYVPHFFLIAEGGFDFSPYPTVNAWFDRLTARPAWKQTADLIFRAP